MFTLFFELKMDAIESLPNLLAFWMIFRYYCGKLWYGPWDFSLAGGWCLMLPNFYFHPYFRFYFQPRHLLWVLTLLPERWVALLNLLLSCILEFAVYFWFFVSLFRLAYSDLAVPFILLVNIYQQQHPFANKVFWSQRNVNFSICRNLTFHHSFLIFFFLTFSLSPLLIWTSVAWQHESTEITPHPPKEKRGNKTNAVMFMLFGKT